MTYQQTIDYLYNRLPMFTRVGAAALKPGLQHIIDFCEQLDNPQNTFKTIHIGGTNGKGSTSHMLAAILQKAGYKTGLYTSPHLKDFRERIRINGEMVSEQFIVDFVADQQQFIEQLDPSFFEVTVAMAFKYFELEKVDVAVIEVGLGGRLDSTNIITPNLSIITNISLDHTNLLGNTTQEIALEKAGIIKQDVPVIIGEYDNGTAPVFIEKAKLTNSQIIFADQKLQVASAVKSGELLNVTVTGAEQYIENLKLDLTGTYQLKNILTVVAAVEKLQELGYDIKENDVANALVNVKGLTGLLGRWQTLSTRPLTICDTGHNEAGIKEVLKNIEQTPHEQLHFVIGMVKDKDITKVLSLLPGTATYYFCAPVLERAMPAEILALQAENFGLKGKVYSSVSEAVKSATLNAGDQDLVFIGGSTFVVAEALQ